MLSIPMPLVVFLLQVAVSVTAEEKDQREVQRRTFRLWTFL
jgi:hypothetical protein